jgi:osmotically-inducible protein OsmY
MIRFNNAVALIVAMTLQMSLTGCGSLMSGAGSEPLEHDPGERSMGAQMDDETIETRAKVNIDAADKALKAAHINVISYNGYVLIVGQVPEQALKDKVSAIVTEIRDVRRIYNELEIAGNNSMMTRSSDTWITTKVKSNLLSNAETEGNRVKVVTENGVVYLMGLATRAEGDRIEEAASASQGVQKVVSVFEYID